MGVEKYKVYLYAGNVNVNEISLNNKSGLSNWSDIPTMSIHPKEMKSDTKVSVSELLFIVTIHTVAKIKKIKVGVYQYMSG